MKYKIQKEKIELSLERTGKKVFINVIDNNGATWAIMIFENGKFEKVKGIPENKGIKIDNEGKIIEKK